MTTRALLGLLVFNLFVASVGIGLLAGVRGYRSWGEVARLAGVAYLLGVASLFVVLTLELVLGIPVRSVTIVLSGLAIAAAGVVVAIHRRLSLPRRLGDVTARPSVVVAVVGAIVVVYLGSLFRASRLSNFGWDVWASWVPKAKAIYFSGGVDSEFFASLPGGSYPPGLPVLNAGALHAMGSADAVTLHLQYWYYAVGFAAAFAGLLWGRVRAPILLPFLLLALLLPDVRNRAWDLYGDVPLGYLVAISALLVLLWIHDSAAWQLVGASILLGGAMLTKREGILFALCVLAAALVATVRQRRIAWPRIGLAGAAAVALAAPWRIWFTLEDLPSDAPEGGYLGVLDHLDRAWPSIELVVRVFFEYDLWLLVPTLAVAAIVLAFAAGARREAVFVLVFLAGALLGCAWTFWSNPSLGLGTEEGLVNRVVGTPVLAVAALTPLLLELAWRAGVRQRDAQQVTEPSRTRLVAATAVVLVAAVGYPALVLAEDGGPRFPSAEDCARPAVDGQPVRVVFGYRETFPEAIELRDRALEVGFLGTEAEQDGCGRVRVAVGGVPSIAVGEQIVETARGVGLDASLERDVDE